MAKKTIASSKAKSTKTAASKAKAVKTAKAPAKKTTASKAKKPAAKAPKKIVAKTSPKPPVAKAPGKKAPAKKRPSLDTRFVKKQHVRLLELRDHVVDQMHGVAQDNLRARPEGSEASAFGMHQADAGSDAYEKDFALSLLSQEQDALYEIEEALKRVENQTYGVCEMSGKLIPKARLEAIPFARFTVECQQKLEKENRGRRRWDTAPQFMDASDNFSDDDDDDDSTNNSKD